ncbi:type II toxin-antitoxin system HicA family toxin [Escherichia coli]|uniref:type II toxin-antitoxin system HicA family toxin n=1 Tax=Escherichia coli TaxID=562 RepID=UPI000EB481FE|nr:type II toxin-antitoxin system HicA family toxin [Escherichia coli]EEX2546040.1 type II toxin-antitoxin system HicA family toxin [Escherichia coli]EEY6112521.1 type II toxin-antitoxin system HicA family toxin [Escherichia coli]EFC1874102.1 type II toxin-antitoxin system HicA family toxin [Escherichia coli]EGS5135141.1 type II toxin-antitoxin system HicA family toxin [Escherichia coli]EGS5162869.1 type II toxin-antitoxin system HicA family toxin [Escherichia coli]
MGSLARQGGEQSQFKRWLIQQGAEFRKAPGGGSHQKVNLNGKRSVFPDHGSKEMPEPLRKKIMKDLWL